MSKLKLDFHELQCDLDLLSFYQMRVMEYLNRVAAVLVKICTHIVILVRRKKNNKLQTNLSNECSEKTKTLTEAL